MSKTTLIYEISILDEAYPARLLLDNRYRVVNSLRDAQLESETEH